MLADVLYLPETFEGANRKFGKTEFFWIRPLCFAQLDSQPRRKVNQHVSCRTSPETQNVRLRMFKTALSARIMSLLRKITAE